jgi:hypothetical protein
MTTHALAPHCDDPGCLVGVLVGRCTRCGGEGVSATAPCPAACAHRWERATSDGKPRVFVCRNCRAVRTERAPRP